MSEIEREMAMSASTKSFETSLWVNATVFSVMVITFTVLRKKYRTIYEPRTFLTPEDKRSPSLPGSLFGWTLTIWKADYNDILPQNGMDAFLFVHYLRVMLKTWIPVWILSWVVLLPLSSVNMHSGKSGLDLFTFGNVTSQEHRRYSGYVAIAYILTGWIIYTYTKEMKYFVSARQCYLTSPGYASSQANSILVTGIPPHLLTEYTLAKLFSNIAGGVKHIWLHRDLKELPELYKRRLKACDLLESAETALLEIANKAHVKQIKAEAKSGNGADKERGSATLESVISDKERPTHRLPLGKIPFALPLIGPKTDTIKWARNEITETTAKLEKGRANLRREARHTVKNEATGECAIVSGVVGIFLRLIRKFKTKETKEGYNTLDGNEQTYPPHNSAFILFHDQAAAHMAAQSLAYHEPCLMSKRYVNVDPDDVIWDNLSLNPLEIQVRKVITFCATLGLIVVWTFPVAFCATLSNISSLSQRFKWLHWMANLPSPVIGFIQGFFPPALLFVLMRILPRILRLFAIFEGIPRKSGIELTLMTRYFVFQVVYGFLFVTLSSGIIAALPQLTSNPTAFPAILAHNLPRASNFFLTYIPVQGLSGTGIGLVQVFPLITYYAKMFIFGSTPRSIYKIKYTLRSIAWGTAFPLVTILMVITLAYSVISPIINGLAVMSFFLLYMLYKYLFLYQFEQPKAGDTGGLFFPKALQHLFVGLYIMQICLAALFFLTPDGSKNRISVPEGILIVILIIFTVGIHFMLNTAYNPLIEHLPLSLAEKAKTAYMSEKMDDDLEEALPDFCHPAIYEPQRPIWIPADRFGFSKDEVKACRNVGVQASADSAEMDEKGRVDINDHPPASEEPIPSFCSL